MRSRHSLLLATVAASALCLATRGALAQTVDRGPIAILGFVATPTEDEAARTMTAVLESSARRLGFTLAPGMPSLEQALALAGCEDAFLDDCMPQIVSNLNVQRVLYGRVSRSGSLVLFELSVYDGSTHARRSADRIEVARALAVDSDTLGRVARRAIDALIPVPSSSPPTPITPPSPAVPSSSPRQPATIAPTRSPSPRSE